MYITDNSDPFALRVEVFRRVEELVEEFNKNANNQALEKHYGP